MRAAKTNHYKKLAQLRNANLPLGRKNGTPLSFQLNVLYIFPSLGDRSNKSRAFPTPSSYASTSTSDFIPREKWSNKITESTRQQQTPLNQRSVPPAFSLFTPASVSPSHFAHTSSHPLFLLSRFNEVLFRFLWSPCNLEIYDSTPLVCP